MIILISSNSGWNLRNFREQLILRLMENGNQVIISCPHDRHVCYFEELGCSYAQLEFKARAISPFQDSVLLFKIIGIIKKEKPDVILSFTIKPNIYFGIVSRIFSVPLVSTITGLGSNFLQSDLRAFMFKMLYKFCLKKAFHCFFQNSDDLNYFCENKIISRKKAKKIGGSGVDLSKFHFKRLKTDFKQNKTFKFLYTGRIIEDKGLNELIEVTTSLKQNHDISVRLVGKFDEDLVSKKFKQNFNKAILDKTIEYYEFVDDIRPHLRDCHCLVQPSYREGSSRSILEGMAMELPVIATDVPGCNNLVDNNKTGLLCEPKNTSDLYRKMETISKLSSDRLIKMGKEGRKIIEKQFDVSSVNDVYMRTIKKVKQGKNV